jgi:NCS1 family nucleobase:cation symporter-1
MSRIARGVGVIETRGIEPVPATERIGSAAGLFWLWLAANMGVLGITLGAALVALVGLNVWQALLAAVVGAGGSFAVVGWLSTSGKLGGAPGLTLSRAVFGIRGNWAPTLVGWLGFVGWETVMCTTAAFALVLVLQVFGVEAGVFGTILVVLVVVALAAVIGWFGHATIMWIQKWLTVVFGAATLVVVVFLATTVDWAAALLLPAAPVAAVVSGVGFIAAGTGIGWLAAGPDYTRYLPPSVRGRTVTLVTVAGAGIPLVLLIGVGALMAITDSALAGASDPVAAIGAALPGWMLVPYLITAAMGLIAAADLSMYSSGLSLLAGGVPLKRTHAVLIDAVLIIAGSLYITVIAEDFFGPFTTFLTLLALPLSAWAGIFGIDLRRRSSYDPEALLDARPGGGYWFTHGVHWGALGTWLVATGFGVLFTRIGWGERVLFTGPLADNWIGQNSLGWLVAGLAAAAVYWVLEPLRHHQASAPRLLAERPPTSPQSPAAPVRRVQTPQSPDDPERETAVSRAAEPAEEN